MEGANEEVDFSKLGIDERITHKNWKARVSGYEELAKQLPLLEDKEFQKYSGLMKKIVLDTNAAAQEKAMSAVLAYVDYCPVAGKYVDGIVAGIATKCLTSTRAKTKELSNDIVLMCVEIEKQEIVLEELIKGLEQKTPKNVAACLAMIRKCLNCFGYKVISVKPLIPTLSKFLEGRDPGVREETKQLTIEIYRWVKDALVPQLSSLKPILLQELTIEFEKVKGLKASPERLLRSQQQQPEIAGDEPDGTLAAVGENVTDEVDEEEIDPFELMPAVDILSKLPGDFYTLLEAKKWQERKDALEKLQQLLEANPKLVTTGDYHELIKKLKNVIGKDTNIVVATLGIKCLSMLAAGLRKGFNSHANGCVSVLLNKFKEKKANVVQTLRECIDAVYQATNLEAIAEDLTGALDNKNPSIRSETSLFLARSFAKTNPALVNKKLLKTLVTSLLKTLNDPDPTVRESSAEALGTLSKAQGERNMAPLLLGLEAIKMAKIEEYKAKVEVKKFAAPPVAPVVASPPKKPTQGKRPVARPAPKLLAASSQESLDDFGPPPVAKVPPKPAKFGQVKSRLGIDRGASSTSLNNAEGSKYGTTVRRAGPGASRSAAPSKTTTSASGIGKKTDDVAAGQPMMNSNIKLKEQRIADEKALKVLKWNFTTPREEFYILLKELMITAEWNPLLVTYLFHSDFKFHIKGIDMIRDYLVANQDDSNMVVANIDLILKWIALRFFDTNPSVILKELELLLVIFRNCEAIGYVLTDIEANSFLPYLVLKLGDAKDGVRNKVHEILMVIRSIYPPTKLFAHLFTGLTSKNSRQRATCLEEIALLIELKGMAIFQPPNSITLVKDIAKLIAERDNSVRNGALSCIVQVYFLQGEKVFKMVGNLSDKEMSLVEERIKRASKTRPTIPPPAQETSSIPSMGNGSSSGLPTFANGGGGGIPRPGNYQTPDLAGRSRLRMQAQPRDEFDEYAPPPVPTAQGSAISLRMQSSASLRMAGIPSSAGEFDGMATFSKSRSASNIKRTSLGGSRQLIVQQAARLSFGSVSDRNEDYGGQSDYVSSTDYTSSEENAAWEAKMRQHQVKSEEWERRLSEILDSPVPKLQMRRGTSRLSSDGASSSSGVSPTKSSGRESIGSFRSNTGGRPSFNQLNEEFVQKFEALFSSLSNNDLPMAIAALEHLIFALRPENYEKYQPYIESKVDKLIFLCNKQYRLFLSEHYPNAVALGDPEAIKNAEQLYRCISSVVTRVFSLSLGKAVSRDTIRELFTHLLPFVTELKSNEQIFQATNYVIITIISGADVTNMISALIRMLHDYVGHETDPDQNKYLELTMRFMWRISKFINKYIDTMDIDVILFETHVFFTSYPRNWWKTKAKNDLPLRTLKTLVFVIVQIRGDAILENFTKIEKVNESELFYYVQKSLRHYQNTSGNNSKSTMSTTEEHSSGMSTASPNESHTIDDKFTNGKAAQNDNQHRSPLKTKKVNVLANGTKQTVKTTIPDIQTEDDLKRYVLNNAEALQISLRWEDLKKKPITSLEEAREAVDQARKRLETLKQSCTN